MSVPPMDMLRTCKMQFEAYAKEHRAKADAIHNPPAYRERAAARAKVNQKMADDIQATLDEWG